MRRDTDARAPLKSRDLATQAGRPSIPLRSVLDCARRGCVAPDPESKERKSSPVAASGRRGRDAACLACVRRMRPQAGRHFALRSTGHGTKLVVPLKIQNQLTSRLRKAQKKRCRQKRDARSRAKRQSADRLRVAHGKARSDVEEKLVLIWTPNRHQRTHAPPLLRNKDKKRYGGSRHQTPRSARSVPRRRYTCRARFLHCIPTTGVLAVLVRKSKSKMKGNPCVSLRRTEKKRHRKERTRRQGKRYVRLCAD
ncbi:hypothetical protein K438DRAFT_198227 [Mycena galopus ATCC 62051]|nr:hypothetical protein K438DRAFT_198227 [Mycena galopus ATCC 62051]